MRKFLVKEGVTWIFNFKSHFTTNSSQTNIIWICQDHPVATTKSRPTKMEQPKQLQERLDLPVITPFLPTTSATAAIKAF